VRVVVTGGAGGIGRFVVRELAAVQGSEGKPAHEITVLDAGPPAGPPVPGPDGVRYMSGDVRDLGQVYGALHGADAVIHLAAIRRPGIAPDDVVFTTNVLGTFNVHEAAWRLDVRRVVSTSSEAALGWDYRVRDFVPDYLPIDEDHPVRPQDPYGLSKVAGEEIARSYGRRGLETIALRPPWVALPEAFDELSRAGGRRLSRFATASYVDVRDLAAAYRLALEAPADRVAGSPVLFVVADDPSIAEPLSSFMPRMLPAIGNLAAALGEGRPAVSNERAKVALGWRPRRSWRQPAQADEDAAAGRWDR
jgi:nucleoside-diphosphate-sugar epimerase